VRGGAEKNGTASAGASSTVARRDLALDYLRATALFLMSLIHMWRSQLGRSGADALVLFVGEISPCLFFFAFGMTQNRTLNKRSLEIVRYEIVLGLIAAFHSFYLVYRLVWDFFQFLWFASLLLIVGSRVGIRRRGFVALSGVILLLNAVCPLGVASTLWDSLGVVASSHRAVEIARHLWLVPGAFFPLPWAAVVFLGFAVGVNGHARIRRLVPFAGMGLLTALAVGAIATRSADSALGFRFALDKWTATSTYMVLGCSASVLLYAAFDRLRLSSVRNRLDRSIRFASDHLLVGTILHYLVVRGLTAERFGPWTFAGVRTVSSGWVLLWSVANLVLLNALLRVTVAGWNGMTDRFGKLLHHVRFVSVATISIVFLIVLYLCRASMRLGYLKWSAYVAMLGLALFYTYDRRRWALNGAR